MFIRSVLIQKQCRTINMPHAYLTISVTTLSPGPPLPLHLRMFQICVILHPETSNVSCTTIHRYPIFSTRYSVMCKVYTGYLGISQIEHGLCACTVDNPIAKARGLSLRTGAQTMLYLSLIPSLNMSPSISDYLKS